MEESDKIDTSMEEEITEEAPQNISNRPRKSTRMYNASTFGNTLLKGSLFDTKDSDSEKNRELPDPDIEILIEKDDKVRVSSIKSSSQLRRESVLLKEKTDNAYSPAISPESEIVQQHTGPVKVFEDPLSSNEDSFTDPKVSKV